MILFFIYTHDEIQKAVKLETSLLAERRKKQAPDGSETIMFDELVMDEEYDILFRRLFLDGHAEVVMRIPSRYLADTPTDLQSVFTEYPDFRQDRDFGLWLSMHEGFPMQYRKSIDIKLQQFLIDYICYRWLETKSPEDAATYFSRLDKTIEDVQRMLIRTTTPIRRLPSFP
jgi:hypothetical protein